MLTVDQNIRFFAGIYGLRGRPVRSRAASSCSRWPTCTGASRPRARSGRRVAATARAGLRDPSRTAYRVSRRADGRRRSAVAPPLLDADRSAVGGGRHACSVTTHYLDEAEHCHRIAIIHARPARRARVDGRAQADVRAPDDSRDSDRQAGRSHAAARSNAGSGEDQRVRDGRPCRVEAGPRRRGRPREASVCRPPASPSRPSLPFNHRSRMSSSRSRPTSA